MSTQSAIHRTSSSESRQPAYERLAWSAICERYPNEWVVLAHIQWRSEGPMEIATALLLSHHPHAADADHFMRNVAHPFSLTIADFTGILDKPLSDYFPDLRDLFGACAA